MENSFHNKDMHRIPVRKKRSSRQGNTKGLGENVNWRPKRNEPNNDQPSTSRQNQSRGPCNRNYKNEKTIGFKYLEELISKDPQEIILNLSNDRNGFLTLLDNKNISPDMIILIVQVLQKICQSTFSESKITLLMTVLQSHFMDKVANYSTNIINQTGDNKKKNKYFWNDPATFWDNLFTFIKTVYDVIPINCPTIIGLLRNITIFVPLIEQRHKIFISDSIKASASNLLNIVEKTIENLEIKRKTNTNIVEDLEPPNDFRDIEIMPSTEEILTEVSPFLRENVINKAYKSVNHYLDVQFRLLREDFVAPLRRGIKTYLNNQNKCKSERRKVDDIKIYNSVKFLSVETINENNCYKIQFDYGKKKGSINYQHSKRFLFGSLICFSHDNFKTLLFGKIAERDIKLLEKGMLIVGFDEEVTIDYEINYIMIESSIYFEPYYWVLRALKNIGDKFPMENYIIKTQTDIESPQYLLKIDPVIYKVESQEFWALNIPKETKFYGLNASQLEAFRASLTQEFCIIQGPPGTGKTFLGLQIARTLLNNRHAWYQNSPMLVVCYTNHALDQFLEGLLPTTKKILRVGGQCKNETLKQYNLTSIRRNRSSEPAVHQKRREVRDNMEKIQTIKNTLNDIFLNNIVINFESFRQVIKNYENTWFAKASDGDVRRWLLEGRFANKLQKLLPRNQRQMEDDIHNVMQEDQEAEINNIILDDEHIGYEDDIFQNLAINSYDPLVSLEEFRTRIKDLKNYLNRLSNEDNTLEVMLEYENTEMLFREVTADLEYVSTNLAYYGQPLNRKKPNHMDLTNPFNMSYPDRWELYFYWLNKYIDHLRRIYEETSVKFRQIFRVYNELRDMADTQIMKQNLVVGMTTTGAARLQTTLQALKCPIVIVEEAAEILEAHIVAALTNDCKHLILIGDHLQLKPSAADFKIKTKYKLGVSLFERMVNNDIQCYTLNVQHRMRPEISRLIKPSIYSNLEDHECTLERPPILGIEKSLYFINHQEQEDLCQDESKKNVHEAKFLIALARHLILNGYEPEQITIIATYLGQMFEMHRERRNSNNALLEHVRITVLDNYQGEECDIILLSLVRSNSENKAGFLRIQNRVCVALSRARDGFYLIGNMSVLLNSNSENEIWQKVNETLEEQNAIGPNLTLKCQVHPFKLTQVSKSDDFLKISEGGCDLPCEVVLLCGHICKRLCHIQDRDHALYKCNEQCNKVLCNNETHICKKFCYEDCGPCTYLVERELNCGHIVNLPCHIDPDKYNCIVPVFTKLPCDHEVDKPCSDDPDKFKCPRPCDTRVEPCGHACERRCHFKFDPDHLKYNCKESCAKPKVGCQETKDKHVCTKLCFEECEECNTPVKKRRSCGHVFTIACKLDIEDEECKKPCLKSLPCGHKCKNKCCEDCGPCEVLVFKSIEDCKHTVKVKCYETPKRSNCISKNCPRRLSCGHKCPNSCSAPCIEICETLVDCNIDAPCGHIITKIQCGLNDSTDTLEFLKFCSNPCGVELKCQHKCSGTCGECKQSRIHKRCMEKCGVPLVCNHECSIPCRKACKPCIKPCEIRCRHSKCKKKCGEPCTLCVNQCPRRCQHVACSKRCGNICDVPPCEKRCEKRLKCGHPCVGFCGDPCPNLCRICDEAELTDIYLGNEDDPSAIYVMLNDCKHIFEHNDLKDWLNQNSNQIKYKVCPRCSTNITTTERYSDYIKNCQRDVRLVKEQFFGKASVNEDRRQELLNDAKILKGKLVHLVDACSMILKVFEIFEQRLNPVRNHRRQAINNIELNVLTSKMQLLTNINNCFKDVDFDFSRDDKIKLQLNFLLEFFLRSNDEITDQEIEDLELEITRLNRIIQFQKLENNTFGSFSPQKKDIQEILFCNNRYSSTLDDDLKNKLEELATKCNFKLTDAERLEIVKAVGLSKGHWYKCPNGHPYAIGECGGANQIARCICGAEIGGTDHHLLPTNQHAGEMDGSNRHAWPGGLY